MVFLLFYKSFITLKCNTTTTIRNNGFDKIQIFITLTTPRDRSHVENDGGFKLPSEVEAHFVEERRHEGDVVAGGGPLRAAVEKLANFLVGQHPTVNFADLGEDHVEEAEKIETSNFRSSRRI